MVKKTLTILLFFISSLGFTQIAKVEMQINGMVCSLCTRSVQKSLEKLSFVSEVDADLETLRTIVIVDDEEPVSFNLLAKSVERAGFSIGELRIHFKRPLTSSISENCMRLEEGYILSSAEPIDWPKTRYVRVINKEFLSPEDYKKWGNKVTSKCGENEQIILVNSSL